MKQQKQMTKLELVNKQHFKDNPNAVRFCKDCNLEEEQYCEKCAKQQRDKLDDFLGEIDVSFEIAPHVWIDKTDASF